MWNSSASITWHPIYPPNAYGYSESTSSENLNLKEPKNTRKYAFYDSEWQLLWDPLNPPSEWVSPYDVIMVNGSKFTLIPEKVRISPIESYLSELPQPVNAETHRFYWDYNSYPKNANGTYSKWSSDNSPYIFEGDRMW